MDERAIKRLVVTLIVAIAIIMLAKFMLTKTFTNLNRAAAIKKQAVNVRPPVNVQAVEAPAASAVIEASGVDAPAVPSAGNSTQ
jgi:hypothetical protein